MKRLTLSAVFALAVGLITTAPIEAQNQRPADRPDRLEQRLAYLDEELDLTDQQEQQVRAILTVQREKLRGSMEERRAASREERRTYMSEQRDSMLTELEVILNPDQLERLEELRPEEGRMLRGRQGRRGPRGRQDRIGRNGLSDRLDLTEDQQTQIRGLIQAQREEMSSWREANPDATRDERMAQLREQRDETRSAIRDVLTPEQIERLDELEDETGNQFRERPNRTRSMRRHR